jgi:hypothetical protein
LQASFSTVTAVTLVHAKTTDNARSQARALKSSWRWLQTQVGCSRAKP